MTNPQGDNNNEFKSVEQSARCYLHWTARRKKDPISDEIVLSDPVKVELRYFKYAKMRTEVSCFLVIESNIPSVPNSRLDLKIDSELSMRDREKCVERRVSLWSSPEEAQYFDSEKWFNPTPAQCRALKANTLNRDGAEIKFRTLANKMGYYERSVKFFFAEKNPRPVPYLVWRKLVDIAGKYPMPKVTADEIEVYHL